MSFIHLPSKTLKINTFLFICFLMVSILFQGQLFAQDIEKINHLKELLNETSPNQKADILKSISDEYKNFDKQKQIEYAQKIVDLPDTLVNIRLKSEMYELLSNYYKSKANTNALVTTAAETSGQNNTLAIIVFIISLLVLIATLIYVFALRKKNLLKIEALESKAVEVYNQKYEKLKDIESKLEKELEPLKLELAKYEEQEVELKKNLKNLEEANYLKNAFLSNMSHEIRTSLNGISGFANILETELALIAEVSLYSHAQKIQQSGNKLENLLSNIIEISRLEANVVEKDIKAHNVKDIIDAVVNANTFKANEKGLVFKSKTDKSSPFVLADNEKLKRVLNVLVDNAIKYTDRGFVTLEGSYDEDSNSIKIDVNDTGGGIQKEYAMLINNVFNSNIDEQQKSYQGIGIGLRLSKKFVDLMDGSIQMKTTENKGSSFSVFLPASKLTDSTTEEAKSEKPAVTLVNVPQLGSLDIFIVEDDRMNRMVLEKMLKKSGSITTAVDGDDAMKLIKKRKKKGNPFHVMLFDINLPAPWDGTRLMQEVRRTMPEYKNIPFIAQTAYAMAGDKNRFLEAGFDDYIAKPIIKTELLTLMEKQLAKFSVKNS